jgi:hypothetical protein
LQPFGAVARQEDVTSPNRLRAILTTLAAAVALTAGTVAPATAETETHRDRKRDAVKDWSEDHLEKAPRNKTADVTMIESTYGDRRLTITVTVRRIGDDIQIAPSIGTPDGKFHGRLWWVSGEGKQDIELREGEEFSKVCKGAVHGSVDKEADTVTFWVPWRCLGRPDWVRTGSIVWTTINPAKSLFFADEARRKRDGYVPGNWARLGPEIAYG